MQTTKPVSAFATPPDRPSADPNDISALIGAIQGRMEEMRAENDAIAEEIRKKGAADAVLTEKVDRLNNQITVDLQALQRAQDEQGRRLAALVTGGNGGGDRRIEVNARRFMMAATGQRIPASAPVDLDGYRAYCDAFTSLIMNGLQQSRLAPDVRNALSVGSDRDGGFLVPDEISSELERRVFDTSPMRQVARTISISTGEWKAPYKSAKGVSGGWVAEKGARMTTGTPTVGLQRIPVHEQYAYPEVTQEMLDDPAIDVESMLVMDTEDEMSRTENDGFVTGDGVGKPTGFLHYKDTAVTTPDKAGRDWGVLQYVPLKGAADFPKLSSGADDGSGLIDLITALHPTYRQGAVFTMNRQSEAAVRKLRDADGRYLVGFGDIRDGTMGFTIHGYPIVNFEDMPDIGGNAFPIAFGNFRRGYYVIDRMGFRVLMDPYTNKPYVGFYISKRVGGDVRNFDAIKLAKVATT